MKLSPELDRRKMLQRLGAAAALSSALMPAAASDETLAQMARRRGILFGFALNAKALTDSAIMDVYAREAGIVAPIGLGAWGNTHKTPETWDFRDLDAIVTWARRSGRPMRGTHLVWHQNLPPWFAENVTAANASQYMRAHIFAFMGRYRKTFTAWNVVNEAVLPSDGRADGLRQSAWLRLIGPGYIEQAFRLAAEADPSAMLAYNEFGLEADTPQADRKRQAVLRLLRDLKLRGTPVHALGMQAHLSAKTPLNLGKLKAFMNSVADLGLQIHITELDVSDSVLPADVVTRDALVAHQYQVFLTAALDHSAVKTVLLWGLSDRYTWLERHAPRPDGLAVRVLPLDENLQRKPAWFALARTLQGQSNP